MLRYRSTKMENNMAPAQNISVWLTLLIRIGVVTGSNLIREIGYPVRCVMVILSHSCWYSGNGLDFYSGGTSFDYRLGYRIFWMAFSKFSVVFPGECRISTLKWPLIAFFQILAYSSVMSICPFHATLYGMYHLKHNTK